MTNEEIVEAVRRWQSDPYYAPLTCQQDSAHGKLAAVECDAAVVLQCPHCEYQERVIPSALLKASRNGSER